MKTVYKDKEILWLYGIITVPTIIVLLLATLQGEWLLALLAVIILLCFAYLGWPISAKVYKNSILFRTPLRTVNINPNTLVTVKAVGAHDYRAHVSFRTRMNVPVGFRCRQYERAPEFARAVLALIDKAPQAKVSPDALRLLRQVAKGKT